MLGKVKLYVPGIANIISKYGYPDGSVYEYLYEKSTVSGENTQNYWELNKTTRNNEIKMSLGNKQYYSNILKNVPSNCLSDYLTSIVDISALKEKDISSYASNSIVSQSLCRDVESKFVFDLVRLSKELNFDSSDILKLIECDKPQIHKLYVRARDQERKRISSLYSADYEFATAIVEELAAKKVGSGLDDQDIEFLSGLLDNPVDRPFLADRLAKILDVDDETISAIQTIKNDLRLEPSNDICQLGQYTILETVPKLLSSPSSQENESDGHNTDGDLRLSNSHQLNDPKEGRIFAEFLGLAEKNTDRKDYSNSSVYISSMTSNLDSLPMWRQYAGDASGVMMVFKKSFIKRLCRTTDFLVARVCYINPDGGKNGKPVIVSISGLNASASKKDARVINDVESNLNVLKRAVNVQKAAAKKLKPSMQLTKIERALNTVRVMIRKIEPLFKHSDYAYENEYRIVSYQEKFGNKYVSPELRSGSPIPRLYTYLRPYNEASINLWTPEFSEIILGPKAPEIDFIAPYIKYVDAQITVIRSSISYR